MVEQAPPNFIAYTEAAIDERKRRAVNAADLEDALTAEYRAQMVLGRPSRARVARERLIRDFGAARLGGSAIYDALFDFGSMEDAEASLRVIEDGIADGPSAEIDLGVAYDVGAAAVWRYIRDPAHVDRRAEELVRGAVSAAPHPDALAVEALALILEGWRQTRTGDAAAAATIDRLAEITRQDLGSRATILTIAALLEERGEFDRALEMLDKRIRFAPGSSEAFEPTVWRTEGRLATAVGDTARAVRSYERYLKIRQDAEPEVQPEVEEVRRALAELTGG
jgi:tetratricopeptide (TPR) repeat protein